MRNYKQISTMHRKARLVGHDEIIACMWKLPWSPSAKGWLKYSSEHQQTNNTYRHIVYTNVHARGGIVLVEFPGSAGGESFEQKHHEIG